MDRGLFFKMLQRGMMMIVAGLISLASYGQNGADTIKAVDSFQLQINQDSIDARLKFVQDSILAREQFVRDSILRRKQILDSLTFLQAELPPLLEAIQRTMDEDIISHADKVAIVGDSALADYVYHKLPLVLSDPFAPWKGRLSLNAKRTRFKIDKSTNKISEIQSPFLRSSINYANQGTIIVFQEPNGVQNNASGKFFKTPIDSVFFDRNKRIVKIKRYVHFYQLVSNNQRGSLLFTNLSLVKQYQYGANNLVSQYELVKFCDRYSAYDAKEVCSIVKYSVAKQDNNYLITRRNNPANEYSDGTFTLEFDERENIKCISFRVLSNKLVWQRFIELNKEGNVSCYVDKTGTVKNSSRCMIYHNEPNAKYPVEIINTTFEKDGIDYTQTNITTNKTRVRDRMTLEWAPWR